MDITRFVLVYVVQIPIVLVFTYLAIRVLKKKQKYSYVLSFFYINVIIGNILNMIYALIDNLPLVLILHGMTNFFNFFSLGFLYIVNKIILETSLVYTKEQRLKYIISYGLTLGIGMVILIAFQGVSLNVQNQIVWNLYMFLFMMIVVSGFGIVPTLNTSYKILKESTSKEFKRKFIYYYIGLAGLFSIAYMIFFTNFLNNSLFRLITTVYGITIILYLFLIYFGLTRLKPKTFDSEE